MRRMAGKFTFDCIEGTFALKNPNKFGFSLAYSYLCTLFNI